MSIPAVPGLELAPGWTAEVLADGAIRLVAELAAPTEAVRLPLGRLRGQRWLALFRPEPFWMRATADAVGAAIPPETQYLQVHLDDGRHAAVVPLLDRAARCCLVPEGGDGIGLLAETGDPAVDVPARLAAVLVVVDADPIALTARAAAAVQAQLGSGRLRRDKPAPALVGEFGWCTWDAFYHDVSHDRVREGLASLRAAGIRPRFLILDDGWQSTGPVGTPPIGQRLTAFAANAKFPGDLAPTVRMAKAEFGVASVLVWHAFQGYWAGVDGGALPGYGVRDQVRVPSQVHATLESEEMPGVRGWWGRHACGIVAADHIHRFYHDYHRHLRAQGVDGVKVDNQATQEAHARGEGGRVQAMRRCHEALEGSVQVHFHGRLINCMSLSTDMLYQCPASTVTRTSTDFWPNRPKTHGLHLVTNAYVAHWFGEFVHPDWDMFQSGHAAGAFHAAGRAVSGGPVYLSDKPGAHGPDIVRRVALADGTVPTCVGIGRPTADILYRDPTRDPVLLTVANTTPAGGLVGAFNCRYHEQAADQTILAADVRADAVPGLAGSRFAVFSALTGTVAIRDRDQVYAVRLPELGWEMLTFVQVEDGIAVIGLDHLLNPGGSLAEIRRRPDAVEVDVRDAGTLLAWSERPLRAVAAGQALEGRRRADGATAFRVPGPGRILISAG